MAAGVSDGAVIVDTGLNNGEFFKDARQFRTAVNGMTDSVERAGRQMAKGMGNYVRAMQGAHAAAKALSGDQKAIQKEIAKTEARLRSLSEQQELARRKFEAAREAAEEEAARKFQEDTYGAESLPWENEMQAAEQLAEDLNAAIMKVSESFGEFEDTAKARDLNVDIEYQLEKLEALQAQLDAMKADTGAPVEAATEVTTALEQPVKVAEEELGRYMRLMSDWSATMQEDSWSDAVINDETAMLSITRYINAEILKREEAYHDAIAAIDSAKAAAESEADIHQYISGLIEQREQAYDSEIAQIDAAAGAMERERAATDAVANSESRVSAIGHVLDQAFAGVATSAGRALVALGRFAGNGAVGFLKKLAGGAKNAAIQLARLAANAARGGIKRLGALLGGATRSMLGFTRAQKTANGGMGMSLKNLLRYGLGIRSLFVLFNRLRSAIKDGFAEMARSNPAVKSAVDGLRASLNGLKGALATAFAPILTAVAPALSTLIGWLTTAINVIGAFFAALTGQSSYQKAVAGLNSVGGAAGKASGKVQDLKRQLAGFDQLEILGDKDSGGGGGSGSGGGLTYETEQIGNGIADWVKTLKDLWAAADYDGIGRIIGEGINSAFEKARAMISWDALGEKVTRAIDAITGIFNGLVDAINWDLIGRTFGTGINTLLNTANQLLTKIDWEALGKSVAEGLNGLVDEVDWKTLGDTIGARIEALLVSIGSFAANFDWTKLGKSLADGLNSAIKRLKTAIGKVDWKTIGTKLADGINTLFDKVDWTALAGLMKDGAKNVITTIRTTVSTVNWGNAGTKLAKAINGFFADKDLWRSAGETVNKALLGLLDFTKNFVITFDAVKAAKSIKAMLGGIDWPSISSEFWETAKRAFQKAGDFVKVLLGGDVYDEMGDAVDQLWARGSGETSSKRYGESWETRIKDVAKKIGDALGSIDWPGIFDEVKKVAWAAVTGFVDGLFGSENGWFVVKLALAITALKTVIPTLLGKLSTTIVSSFVATKTAGKLAVSGAASGIGTAGETAFAAAAGKIGTAALAALDAMLIAYDASKLIEAAKGYKEAGEAYAKEIDTALASYKTLYDTKGKGVANAWAAQVYGIDTTDCSLVESQQLLVDSITDMWGDAPKNWKDALRDGWNTYFGENGKGLGALLGDAANSFFEWLGLGYEEPVDKGPNGDFTIGLAPVPRANAEFGKSASIWAQAALVELDKGRPPSWIIRHAKLLGWSAEAIQEAADALCVSEDQLAIWLKNDPVDNPFGSILGDEQPTMAVGVDFTSNENTTYKNSGLLGYFQRLFAPGTDTEARVALLQQGWSTITAWLGTDHPLTTLITLGRNGWTTIATFVGTAVTVLTSLGKNGWSSIGDFVGTAVTVLTSLGKNGWSSIGDFVGTAVTVLTSLGKSNWTTIDNFVGTAVTVLTSLKKSGWSSIGKFVGTAVTVLTSLEKSGWTTIGKFVGTSVTVMTSLMRSGWTTIGGFVGTSVTVLTSLMRNGWSSIGDFVGTSVTVLTSLLRNGWSSIGDFVGTSVTVLTSLLRNGWSSISTFVGTSVTVLTSLLRNGWKSIGEFVGTSVDVFTSLKRSGWSSIGKFVGTSVTVLTSLLRSGWSSIEKYVGTSVTVMTSLMRSGWSSIDRFVGTSVTVSTELTKSGWSSILQWLTGNIYGTVSITTNLVAGTVTGFAQAVSKIFFGKTGGLVTSVGIRAFASGGLLTGAGRPRWWDGVQKYASGTSRAHGTLFAAGEAGPEIVGHINGRTEILNKSQLAQTMYSAVASGMLYALSKVRLSLPAVAAGGAVPYEVAARIAQAGEAIEATLNANNEDLIQTIISVIGTQTSAIVAALQQLQHGGAPEGMSLRQIIDGLNRQTQMFGVSPLIQ